MNVGSHILTDQSHLYATIQQIHPRYNTETDKRSIRKSNQIDKQLGA